MKRVMDIETALSWTYREQLPKVDRSVSLGGWNLGAWAERGGVSIDEGTWLNRDIGFPEAEGAPHPDALLIEKAVDSLQGIGAIDYNDAAPIDSDLGFGLSAEGFIGHAWRSVRASVMTHAKLGSRPVADERPYPVRVFASNSRNPAVLCHGLPALKSRKGLYPSGSACPLAWEPSPESVMRDRADYLVWWSALDYLSGEVAGRVESLVINGPLAPQQPWRESLSESLVKNVLVSEKSERELRDARVLAVAERLMKSRRKRPVALA
jgi:hypothetical protein